MLTLFSMLQLVFKRLWHNLGLSASTLVGMIAILTVAVCVPIFSHAISSEVLHQQLLEIKGDTNRQLFSLRLNYQEKGFTSLLDLDKARTITNFLKDQIPAEMNLPVERVVVDIRAGALVVTDLTGRWPEGKNAPMGRWSFLLQDDLPSHATILEGAWPDPEPKTGGPIQAAVPEAMADEMLLKIGDHFLLSTLEVELTGFYRINDLRDPIWFTNPETDYSRTLWVNESTYQARIRPATEQPIGEASWYVIINNDDVHFQRASDYLRGLVRLDASLKKIVDGLSITYTPAKALEAYEQRADALTTLFYVVGSPMIVLALIFIGLTARIAVQQVENETATLRARGASPFEILLLNLAETVLLLLIALPLSIGSGWWAANLMGNTLSFLQFTDRSAFSFSLDGINLSMLGLALGVILVARFMPAVSGSRINVLKVKQEQSRGSPKPIWERFYLDFLLLIPGGYAFFVLKGWSKPAQFLTQLPIATDSQFRDPLLFVAPALFAIALCMVMVRMIPLLVRLLAALVERLHGVTAYLSLQQIARRSQDHSSALLLIMISLSLAIFTISTAKTLDRWLYDSEYYKVGADISLQEYLLPASAAGSGGEGGPAASGSTQMIESFLTLEEHMALPGVDHATRFGKYTCTFSYGRGDQACAVIGVDRLEFPMTAFFRDDFTQDSLGSLMNALGSNLSGVVFPAALMQKSGVAVGDKIALSVAVGTQKYDREFLVVGSYDYFPTVFPKDKPTLITNLESIFNYPEDVEDYQVWLKLDPRRRCSHILTDIGAPDQRHPGGGQSGGRRPPGRPDRAG